VAIILKSPEEIAKMRIAGRLASDVLDMIGEHVQAGVTTAELDRLCHRYIEDEQSAVPATLGYKGYQHATCISINQQICHGIPSERKLKRGDIVNIDVTVIKDGWYGDNSRMADALADLLQRKHPGVPAQRLLEIVGGVVALGRQHPGARHAQAEPGHRRVGGVLLVRLQRPGIVVDVQIVHQYRGLDPLAAGRVPMRQAVDHHVVAHRLAQLERLDSDPLATDTRGHAVDRDRQRQPFQQRLVADRPADVGAQ